MSERHIVVVEDESEVMDLIRDVLRLDGHRVVGVACPERLPAAMEDTRPDLFLLDLMLPGMTGIELAEHLYETTSSPPPMIALSASRLMLEEAQNSGHFAATLRKPFDISTLLDTVTGALRSAKPVRCAP